MSDADLPRLLLLSGDRIIDSAGEETARIVRPRWSLRTMFSRTQEEVRLVRPDGTTWLSLPQQTEQDIHSLWVKNADGDRLATVERRGGRGLTGSTLDVADASGRAMGTIAAGNAHQSFEARDLLGDRLATASLAAHTWTLRLRREMPGAWEAAFLAVVVAAEEIQAMAPENFA
ncbi:hypothetical protein [Thermomonospora cellulosilytica]|uniref:Uncharacterized protein n=1 Tax=Thermomonospora cellulosilytica TaxID=1411118 RepID=A0A7W3MTF8_9ACTN|nr:hypothetical protein [Thermomonospora cellulosilytica]MBA9001580.1 hypothetical protein [Thermomonospora cellulosilytica]